jgi:hypothetical protein
MANDGRIVLLGSADVARSIGRPGLLEARLETAGSTAVVSREPPARFDVLRRRLDWAGEPPEVNVPEGLEGWFAAQFATELPAPDLIMGVLTVRDELVAEVWRHREGGWLVQPPTGVEERWTEPQRSWLAREFEPTTTPSADESIGHLRHIADAVAGGAVLVVFNASTYDPAGVRFDFSEDVLAVRAHRLDLALERLAGEIGLAVIDVDRGIAEFGAERALESAVTYTVEASAVIAEDALRAVSQLGVDGLSLEGDVMRLDVPAYDRRTTKGRIDAWHVRPGSDVERGSPLFDLTFENIVHRLDYSAKVNNRSMSLTVLAAATGRVARVDVGVDVDVDVGQTVGVVVADAAVEAPLPSVDLGEGVPPFRVGIRVKEAE